MVSHWGHAFSNGLHAGEGIVNKVERASTSTITSTSTSTSREGTSYLTEEETVEPAKETKKTTQEPKHCIEKYSKNANKQTSDFQKRCFSGCLDGEERTLAIALSFVDS